jgi:hypothetical protein
MPQYRKRPIVIEAFQLTIETRQNNVDWPQWAHIAWNKDRGEIGSLYPTEKGTADGTMSIKTLEGKMRVSFGDYIIQGVHGEIYPCKEEIFKATYESLDL